VAIRGGQAANHPPRRGRLRDAPGNSGENILRRAPADAVPTISAPISWQVLAQPGGLPAEGGRSRPWARPQGKAFPPGGP